MNLDKLKSLEIILSRVCGRKVEITIRGLRDFTFSFEGEDQSGVDKIRDYFKEFTDSCLVDYDKECDYTCVYITIIQDLIRPVRKVAQPKIIQFPTL